MSIGLGLRPINNVRNNVYNVRYSKTKLYLSYTNNVYACYKNIELKEAFYILW